MQGEFLPLATPRRRTALIALLATASLALVSVLIPGSRSVVALAAGTVLTEFTGPFAPDVESFDDLPQPTVVLAIDGSELARLGDQRTLVPLRDISTSMRQAVLAAEDASFYTHRGVDPVALVRAIVSTLDGDVQGGSTITQQLAKLNYVGSSRTLVRKVREVLYAAALERRYSKDELLERYLNQVSFGQGAHGIGPAAERFFATTPSRLTPAQAAMLAGKIRSPEHLDPWRRPDETKRRRDAVLRAMTANGWLREPDAKVAAASPLAVGRKPVTRVQPGPAPHFVQLVRREAARLSELGGSSAAREKQLLTGGYSIHTTLDPRVQRAAMDALRSSLGRRRGPSGALVAVEPGDGAVRAYASGTDARREFDLAGVGRRQPGSAFKPFVYMAALEKNIDPRTTLPARPTTLECNGRPWPVANASRGRRGMLSIDDGLVHSVNAVYAQLSKRVGTDAMRDVAMRAGVSATSLAGAECAMALGGLREGVTPLELASAYGTFAARGERSRPYAISRIVDRRGRGVYEHRDGADVAFDPQHVAVLSRALGRVVAEGTGRGVDIGRPVAGKTGTTDENADAWFAGYVPQLSAAVWIGHPDARTPMSDRLTGGSLPAQIFSRFMRAALQGVPVAEIPMLDPNVLWPTPPPAPTPDPAPLLHLPTAVPVPDGSFATPPPASAPPTSTSPPAPQPTAQQTPTPAPTPTCEPQGDGDGKKSPKPC